MKRSEPVDAELELFLASEWFDVFGGAVFVNRPGWQAELIRYQGTVTTVPSANNILWTYPKVMRDEKQICRELLIVTCRLATIGTKQYEEYVWRVCWKKQIFDVRIHLETHAITVKPIQGGKRL